MSILSLPCICFMAAPAFSMAASVSLLIFAASIEYICCSRVEIWATVWSRVCSCCFFRRNAAFAAVYHSRSVKEIRCTRAKQPRFNVGYKSAASGGYYSPFLLVLTFFLAIASCSSIWFCRCLSRFWSISSCDRNPRIAFLGVSFRLWALCPPNQPQMPDIL